MPKISKFIERYENRPINIALWLGTALFIIFVRDSIECLNSTGYFPIPDGFHIFYVSVFFISLLLSISILLHLFSKTEIQKVTNIALVCLPVIIFPVTLDFIVTRFTGAQITYKYISTHLLANIPRFLDPTYKIPEIPLSLRFEIGLIALLAFGYIFFKRKRIFPAAAGSVCVFLTCYLYCAIPAILSAFCNSLNFTVHALHLKNFPFSKGIANEPLIALINLWLTALLALVWLWRFDPAKGRAVVGNMRPTRSIHYVFLCLLGILFSSLGAPIQDVFTPIRMASMALAIFFAFQFSVVINDIFDVECDTISNAGRPLVTQTLSQTEYLNIAGIYLALSLLLAYWVNETCAMITLLYISLYFLYSAPPLRLKRFFPLSCVIVGLEALLAFLAGALSFSSSEEMHLSSMQLSFNAPLYPLAPVLWLIFLVFFLSSNIKDLKDTAGDKKTSTPTLTVLLGEKNGRRVIAFLVFLSYSLVPLFLSRVFPGLNILLASLGFALANFIYVQREKSSEKIVFVLYFIYALFLMWMIGPRI